MELAFLAPAIVNWNIPLPPVAFIFLLFLFRNFQQLFQLVGSGRYNAFHITRPFMKSITPSERLSARYFTVLSGSFTIHATSFSDSLGILKAFRVVSTDFINSSWVLCIQWIYTKMLSRFLSLPQQVFVISFWGPQIPPLEKNIFCFWHSFSDSCFALFCFLFPLVLDFKKVKPMLFQKGSLWLEKISNLWVERNTFWLVYRYFKMQQDVKGGWADYSYHANNLIPLVTTLEWISSSVESGFMG